MVFKHFGFIDASNSNVFNRTVQAVFNQRMSEPIKQC